MGIVEEKYRALTNVDIEEQKRLWDERGKGVLCHLNKLSLVLWTNWVTT